MGLIRGGFFARGLFKGSTVVSYFFDLLFVILLQANCYQRQSCVEEHVEEHVAEDGEEVEEDLENRRFLN